MENTILNIKILCATICATIGIVWGGMNIMVQTLIILTILDYISGILKGAYNKNLSSAIAYKGIIKKMGIYIILAMACIIDKALGINLLQTSVVGFYISVEGISIIENWGGMGLPLPKKLVEILKQLNQDKGDK